MNTKIIAFSVMLILLSIIIKADLSERYRFEDSALDDVFSGNGSFSGALNANASGYFNSNFGSYALGGMNFSTTDYFNYNNSGFDTCAGTNNCSLSFWLNCSEKEGIPVVDLTSIATGNTLISRGNPGVFHDTGIAINQSGDFITTFGKLDFEDIGISNSSNTFTFGDMNYIVLQKEVNTGRLFVNGNQTIHVDISSTDRGFQVNQVVNYLGVYISPSAPLSGGCAIDEFHIYNETLTTSNITGTYEAMLSEVSAECQPVINQNWEINTRQTCSGQNEIHLGTGSLIILPGGTLTLSNFTNLTASGVEAQRTGDAIFINSGSELKVN